MTPSAFRLRFPAFAALSDSTIQNVLNRAIPFFDVGRWGAFYAEGLANWVAHNLIVDAFEGGQPIDQVDGNDATAEHFASISTVRHPEILLLSVNDPMYRTTYGQRYVYLRKRVGLGGAVVF